MLTLNGKSSELGTQDFIFLPIIPMESSVFVTKRIWKINGWLVDVRIGFCPKYPNNELSEGK